MAFPPEEDDESGNGSGIMGPAFHGTPTPDSWEQSSSLKLLRSGVDWNAQALEAFNQTLACEPGFSSWMSNGEMNVDSSIDRR
jgi:hypothetical protein